MHNTRVLVSIGRGKWGKRKRKEIIDKSRARRRRRKENRSTPVKTAFSKICETLVRTGREIWKCYKSNGLSKQTVLSLKEKMCLISRFTNHKAGLVTLNRQVKKTYKKQGDNWVKYGQVAVNQCYILEYSVFHLICLNMFCSSNNVFRNNNVNVLVNFKVSIHIYTCRKDKRKNQNINAGFITPLLQLLRSGLSKL